LNSNVSNEFCRMKRLYHRLAPAVLLLTLSACVSNDTRPDSPAPPTTATPGLGTLSPQARAALDQAEADVERARSAHALWTSAEAALRKAREAAQAGDSAMVLSQAKLAADQARLGLAQKAYPSTEK